MTEMEKRTRAHAEWLEKTLRDFEEWARADQDLWYRTSLLREAYAGMVREIKAHAVPDRALLIQTAAAIAGGLASTDGGIGHIPFVVVAAQAIINVVDGGEEE